MASLYEQLKADIIVAMKAKDSATTTALRTADAAIKKASMDSNKDIDDSMVSNTLRKAVKNLTDANGEFAKGGRQDLIDANLREISLLEKYLPKGLEGAALESLVVATLAEVGAVSKKDMGKVMGALKQRPEASQIDFSQVSKLLQSKLP